MLPFVSSKQTDMILQSNKIFWFFNIGSFKNNNHHIVLVLSTFNHDEIIAITLAILP